MTHSPAPFRISACKKDACGGEYRIISSSVGVWIADVRCGSDEEEANCRLFLAAPKLKAAVELAMIQIDSHVRSTACGEVQQEIDNHPVLKQLREALGEAVGLCRGRA